MRELFEAIKQKNLALIEDIISKITWERLDFDHKSLTTPMVVAICRGLAKNTQITHVYLDSCDINAEGGKTLAKMLANNNYITFVNLMNNSLGESAKDLAIALTHNKCLKTLYLRWNKISEEGLIAIAESLETNTSLELLDVRANKVNNKISTTFAKAIQRNSGLRELQLTIDDPTIERQITEMLRHKERFLRETIWLANDRNNQHSTSFFAKLPLELVLIIMSYTVTRPGNRNDFIACAKFVFANLHQLKPFLKQKCGVHLLQKANNFTFFCPKKDHQHEKIIDANVAHVDRPSLKT